MRFLPGQRAPMGGDGHHFSWNRFGISFVVRWPVRWNARLPRDWYCPRCYEDWRFSQSDEGCCPACSYAGFHVSLKRRVS